MFEMFCGAELSWKLLVLKLVRWKVGVECRVVKLPDGGTIGMPSSW